MAYRMYSFFGLVRKLRETRHEGAFVIKGMKIHQWKLRTKLLNAQDTHIHSPSLYYIFEGNSILARIYLNVNGQSK